MTTIPADAAEASQANQWVGNQPLHPTDGGPAANPIDPSNGYQQARRWVTKGASEKYPGSDQVARTIHIQGGSEASPAWGTPNQGGRNLFNDALTGNIHVGPLGTERMRLANENSAADLADKQMMTRMRPASVLNAQMQLQREIGKDNLDANNKLIDRMFATDHKDPAIAGKAMEDKTRFINELNTVLAASGGDLKWTRPGVIDKYRQLSQQRGNAAASKDWIDSIKSQIAPYINKPDWVQNDSSNLNDFAAVEKVPGAFSDSMRTAGAGTYRTRQLTGESLFGGRDVHNRAELDRQIEATRNRVEAQRKLLDAQTTGAQ
jgi:hypothetical protein